MIGNGTFWAFMICLDLEVVSEYRYSFKTMRIQTGLLDLLQDLPVCVGLGVKGDVHEVEQLYTEVSGINLELAGVFTSGAIAALIRESFPNQKGIVVWETAPMPPVLLYISLEEVIFTTEWLL